jgi:hypothetical protein
LKVSVKLFPHFKTKFAADMLCIQVCHFLGTPELQMEQQTLVLNKILIKSHCYQLTQARTDPADITVSTSSSSSVIS